MCKFENEQPDSYRVRKLGIGDLGNHLEKRKVDFLTR
jgi:hypothetical protein